MLRVASHWAAPFVGAFAALLSAPADSFAAEMGRAPVASGTYVTGEGGYAYQDSEGVFGHGISPTGMIADPSTDTVVNARDGWFAGGSIGFVTPAGVFAGLPVSRVEAYLTYNTADDDRSDTVAGPAATTLKSVDGSALAIVGFTASSSIERTAYDGGVRFAVDQTTSAASSLSWVVTPFVRNAQEDVNTVAIGTADSAWRNADVETWSYGVTIAVEPEIWLTPSFALVGRIGAGLYGYRASGDFHSSSTAPAPDPFAADLSDSENGVGFRGMLGAGVKFKLAPDATLTGFVEADYLSAVGTAELPDNQFTSATTSSVGTDDAWEMRAGLRLSVGLQ